MILARNPLQLLNGSKIWIFILAIVLFAACDILKPVSNGNSNTNGDDNELGTIDSEKPVFNPNVDADGNVVDNSSTNNNTNNTTKNGDRDGDGVIDRVDKCPDLFGLVRLEGCPEPKKNNGNTNNGTGGGKTNGTTTNNGTNNNGKTDNGSVNDPKGNVPLSGNYVEKGNLKSSYKVGILMPFFAQEVSTATTMPASSIQGMNFYEGSLLALQQLSAEGVNLDVEVFDSRRSTAVVQGLVDNYTLGKMDLIIGPAASENVQLVSEAVSKKNNVPMVSLNLNSGLADKNPYFIQASPYFESHASATVAYIKKKYPNRKVILVVPREGKEVSRLTSYHSENNSVRYSEFFAEKTGSTFTFSGLSEMLSAKDTTVVIAPVSDEFFAAALLRSLNSTKNSKSVVVFGMPSWMSYQGLEAATMEGCNLHITNGSFVNNNNEAVKSFKQNFFTEYGTPPTIEAYKGYDLTLYFGRMLNKYGTGFVNNLDQVDDDLLQSSFDFEPVFSTESESGMSEDYKINYFENKFVHILRFKNYQYVPVNADY